MCCHGRLRRQPDRKLLRLSCICSKIRHILSSSQRRSWWLSAHGCMASWYRKRLRSGSLFRSTCEWLACGYLRTETHTVVFTDCPHLLHLYRVLFAQLDCPDDWRATLWFAMGSICINGTSLCLRSVTAVYSSLPYILHEHVSLLTSICAIADQYRCFIIGQLIAAGVLNGLVTLDSQWSYKIPFALQWIWPFFLIPILCFAPESPWHLVRKGRLEEAEVSLRRLQKKSAPIDPKQTLASIVYTNDLEQELTTGTSYMDCFKGTELRRTEVACMVFAGQVLSGGNFAYNSTYFFQQVGLSSVATYK